MSVPTTTTDVAAPPIAPCEFLPRYEQLVTEDDSPVDGIYSEKQMRLLTEPLYTSWNGPGEQRPFLALANVDLFYSDRLPPIVPDVFLSVDVEAPKDVYPKENRSYFLWRFGKSPDVAIEVVSNTEGGEDGKKMNTYAAIGVPYYVIWDPQNLLKKSRLRGFVLTARKYEPLIEFWFPVVNLGLTIWPGEFENVATDWLRWCDQHGNLIPTGREQAAKSGKRVERLEAQLRELGIEPDKGE